MSDLFLEGTIKKIWEEQQISEKFKKREFVLLTDEQYPQEVKFELVQDKCELIQGYELGANIKVHFNVSGRSWQPKDGGEERYFVSLKPWRIEPEKGQPATGGAFPTEDVYEETGGDLPF